MRKIFTDNIGHRWEYEEVSEGLEVYFVGGDNISASVTIPSEIDGKPVVSIAENAFYQSDFVRSVVIPDTVKYINPYAFEECKNLVNIKFGDSVETIEQYAFYHCKNLKDLELPDSLTIIYGAAFKDCHKLESVKFGNSLEMIGYGAFKNCRKLEEIAFPESLKRISGEAFCGCEKIKSAAIPEDVFEIGCSAFADCYSLEDIDVSPDNEKYSSVDGNLYDKEQKTLIQYAIGKRDESFTLPDSVETVKKNALSGCTHLQQVITSYKFW